MASSAYGLQQGKQMSGPLHFDALIHAFHAVLDHLPDTRRGKNTQYAIKYASYNVAKRLVEFDFSCSIPRAGIVRLLRRSEYVRYFGA